jgi:ribonucleotide monophosphatase NagD (HAD superfamily)
MVTIESLETVLASIKNPVVGLDAYGVIYNESGVFETIRTVFTYCWDHRIPILMMTNNASQSTAFIAEKMQRFGLPMAEDAIISSGVGLKELPHLYQMVRDQLVYVYGFEGSKSYVIAAGGHCVDNPHDANVIVLAAATGRTNDHDYRQVGEVLSRRPTIPILCVNPDHYVAHDGQLSPVMGYFAHKMATEYKRSDIVWMGKPYPLFSQLVRQRLDRLGLSTQSLVFCDDNPLNNAQMVQDLGCYGVVITQTGVYHRYADQAIAHPRIYQMPLCKI